jgi:hypothetical protein
LVTQNYAPIPSFKNFLKNRDWGSKQALSVKEEFKHKIIAAFIAHVKQ